MTHRPRFPLLTRLILVGVIGTPSVVCIALAALVVLASCGERGQRSQREWTTPSGLQIKQITEGEGRLPRPGDIMEIVYRASYVGGKEFDRYENRDEPYRFRLGHHQVMPGLDEGCATMRPGAKRILIIPPQLAFDAEPDKRSSLVPPNAWVRFEVELVGVIESPPPPQPWNDAGMEMLVTDSGLQYVDFQVGEGRIPIPGGTVAIAYSGFLDDGTLFDTTYFRNRPIAFTFEKGQLIDGLLEGIATMHVGGMRKLVIPPYLAYGEKGFGKAIPPNATLTFDVELLEVDPPEKTNP